MFCFQRPFTRTSRNTVTTPTTTMGKQQTTKSLSSRFNRRGSEAKSEGSGSSSIQYIDQEISASTSSSTDTLPGIQTDYLESDPLSPDPILLVTADDTTTATPTVTATTVTVNGIQEDVTTTSSPLKQQQQQQHLQSQSQSQLQPQPQLQQEEKHKQKQQKKANGRWRKRILLRLKTDLPNPNSKNKNTNGSFFSPLLSIPTSFSSSAKNTVKSKSLMTRRAVDSKTVKAGGFKASSANDIPSLLNEFDQDEDDDDDDDDDDEDEDDEDEDEEEEEEEEETGAEGGEEDDSCEDTEEGSSVPSSPAAAISLAGLPPTQVPSYYSFLSVNGGAMRQETTSTSSPQLSTGLTPGSNNERVLPSETAETSSVTEECLPVGMSLKKLDTLDPPSCLPAARSCPNLEQQSIGCSSTSGSSSPSPSPGPTGPRFKPVAEGDIQVCYLNHARTVVSKILSSKFLRRWETHHLYLNDACLSSKTLTGFIQQPIPYSSMTEVYAVTRWDLANKYCLRIVLPDGSLLLQARNAYARNQWYHSILWMKCMFKYQHTISINPTEDIILKELKSMVDFALWTPLQDDRINATPLEAVAKLLNGSLLIKMNESQDNIKEDQESCEMASFNEQRNWAEAVLAVADPLLEKAPLPPVLAIALSRLVLQHPKSSLVPAITPAVTRYLKHSVESSKTPDMRKLCQIFVDALYQNSEQSLRDYISYVHGPGSDCPHPRIIPNFISACIGGIFSFFEVPKHSLDISQDLPVPPLDAYLLGLIIISEYYNSKIFLSSVLQAVPFPGDALINKQFQESMMNIILCRIVQDTRCDVHRMVLPIREERRGWIHIVAPSSPGCPDDGTLFGIMLTTLLGCCNRRKKFIHLLLKKTGSACLLMAIRGCDAAQEALCLMLEWRIVTNEEDKVQVISALQSTPSGKERYLALCQRQSNLQELQQKGGPKKLTLPVRATDADVAQVLGNGALGDLESLTLAFTSVTSACAEQIIKLPSLKHLNLWATQFGDAGLQMISEHLPKLQVLNLCETPVTDKGISTLVSLTSLKKLNLNSTKLSAQTYETLKKRLPSLQEIDVRYTEAW
ncbi:C-Maf-inducing protein-like [Microplitis mediator]|uniref:C-Maf-inducing protein-like n=1 Tax=Microplitis mediator TaxID=375433 RepID=UPI0025560775|nr:C-Maf-inducing protein-like [Microplitis mediator]